ncbi:glycosyltransferase [Parabacteroides gordonii]|nr:glycosyltransferase [Parabacteroides gordonii]MCA5586258.1 glycosyltransferase [Parabacteroides gordonii]RGP09873.1 glycosyltransferase [Parabacteroides gordonii]
MKKKNVLVIHRGYPLGIEAGDKVRTLNMVGSLQHMGYNVILLGFFTRGISLLKTEKKTLPKGIKSIFLYSLPNRMRLAKIAELFRAIETFIICKFYSIDIIQAELSASAPCARFVPDIPLITDFHSDLVPELEMGGYSQDVIEHAASENRFALKRSNKIITVSDKLFENLSVYNKIEAQHFVLPCNFNAEPFMVLNSDVRKQLRTEYGLNDKIVLCYSGAFRVWQCIQETLDVVIRLRQLNPSFYLCIFTNDDVTPYSSLLEQLEGNYMVKGLSRTEVPSYLSMADAGFVLRADSLVNINSSPTKTSEYLAAGMMVIATQYAGDAPMQISESSCGIVFDDLSISDDEIRILNEKLLYYVENYEKCSVKAKKYVFNNRIWSSNEVKLVDLYNELR